LMPLWPDSTAVMMALIVWLDSEPPPKAGE
jgi:hypothetical protein